jgi:hypothetical protein
LIRNKLAYVGSPGAVNSVLYVRSGAATPDVIAAYRKLAARK